MITLIKGECLQEMEYLINKGVKVDAVITDIPYGTTANKWDIIIPFNEMWEKINKIVKPNGAIVLHGSEPFASMLRVSNIKNYKYDFIYKKNKGTGHLNAKRQPLNDYETISVFYKKQCVYNPQFTEGKAYKRIEGSKNALNKGCYGKTNDSHTTISDGKRYPKRVLEFVSDSQSGNSFHPTQKPIKLMEYLIKTFTNENETILDFTMGSGTTGVACKNLNRDFVGIELDEKYFNIAKLRING